MGSVLLRGTRPEISRYENSVGAIGIFEFINQGGIRTVLTSTSIK
jgi:hypothetical protein